MQSNSKKFNFLDVLKFSLIILNYQKREKSKKNQNYPFLLPKSYEEDFDPYYKSIFPDKTFKCDIQVGKRVYFRVRINVSPKKMETNP